MLPCRHATLDWNAALLVLMLRNLSSCGLRAMLPRYLIMMPHAALNCSS